MGREGLLECKSRAHGLQLGVICSGGVPAEYMAQRRPLLSMSCDPRQSHHSGRNWLSVRTASARFCYRVREGFCPLRNSSRALSHPPGVDEADLGIGSEGHPEVIFQAPKASSRSASPANRDPATELIRRFFWRSLAYGDVCQPRYPHSHKCSWFVLVINKHKPVGGKGQIWLSLVNNGH